MKNLLFLLVAALCSTFVYGQDLQVDRVKTASVSLSGLTAINPNPAVFVVVDEKRIEVDHLADYDLNPKWIESVDVLKDATSKQIYGNKHGVVMIYTKKKFKRKVLKELNKTATS